MAFVVNSNFFNNIKLKRKAKELRSHLISFGANKDYSSVHQLISQKTYQLICDNKTSLAVIKAPRVITTFNDASNYFKECCEIDKAYTCFSESLRIRNRQKENIDKEILRYIEYGDFNRVQELVKIGYNAYKHTRYLAMQALFEAVLSISPRKKFSEEILDAAKRYAKSGKLKGFYRYYIDKKLYKDHDTKGLVFYTLRKGIRDPLIKRLILKIIEDSNLLKFELSDHFAQLCIATLVESNKNLTECKVLMDNYHLLPENDNRLILDALISIEKGLPFEKVNEMFYRLSLASSRYYVIKKLVNESKNDWLKYWAPDICSWRSSAFIGKACRLLFQSANYDSIINVYESLPLEHKENKQIFSFYVGALRITDQLQKAKNTLISAPSVIPDITILTQEFYIYKKEKQFSKALDNAKKVFQLQPDKNEQRWAKAIVEMYSAESDFEAAYHYVKQNPKYSDSLLPLIHFREGTLSEIEEQLKQRIINGGVDDELHYYLSYLYCERKDYKLAIEHITKAVDLKINRRNCLHYILLKTVVEKDFHSCLKIIHDNNLDNNLVFAQYYAYSLLQIKEYEGAVNYLNEKSSVFNATEKGGSERLLLLSDAARLSGNFKESFDVFAGIFPENQRCFTSKNNNTHSFAVMDLKSTADVMEDKNTPLISVIMTNFGWSDYTSVAIQSILDQTYSNFELIVVDDHSESNSYRKLTKFIKNKRDKRIKLLRLKNNSGTYRAKNHGLKVALGDFITFQDSDDWSHPLRLSKQISSLEGSNMAVLTNYFRVCDGSHPNVHKSNILREAPITLFYRRSVFETLGFFDSTRTSADSEYINRIIAVYGSGSIKKIDKPYYIASYHDRSLTSFGPLSLDPILGVNGLRKQYSQSYRGWHKLIGKGLHSPFVPYPLKSRIFSAPTGLTY